MPVEVSPGPPVEEKDNRQGGSGHGGSEDLRFPAVVELVIEIHNEHGENADEAEQGAQRHEDRAECGAFALARETDVALGESGHVRGRKVAAKMEFFFSCVNRFCPENVGLLQQADGEGVFVFLAIARLHRGHNHENDPGNEENREKEQPDEDEAKQPGHDGVDGIADLEVDCLLARAIQIRAVRALDQPQNERGENVAHGKNKTGEPEKLHDHGEGVVGRRAGRNGGRLIRWRGNGRRCVFHEGEIGFWGGGVNEETAESAEGAEEEVEREFPWL